MDSFETSVASRLLSVLERYDGFSNTDTMIHYNIIQGILLSFASLFPTLASPGRGAVPGHKQGCPGQVMTVRWSCFLHLPHSPPHHPRHHRHHAFCIFLIHLLITTVIMTMIDHHLTERLRQLYQHAPFRELPNLAVDGYDNDWDELTNLKRPS